MSEQTLKILRMLEEGKITADEASDLLSKVETLEEESGKADRGPEPEQSFGGRRHFRVPDPGQINIPPIHIPDINRIVNDALRDAFGEGFPHGRHMPGHQPEHGTPTDFGGARFAGAKLEHTDLTDARLNEETRLQGADLRFASFVDADLRGADLRGANLSYSDFTDANLQGANLQGAQLHHGSYTDADFSGANLKGADLSLSDLTDASFRNVNEPGLALRGMKLVGVKYEAGGSAEDREANDEEPAWASHAGEKPDEVTEPSAAVGTVDQTEEYDQAIEERSDGPSWT